jgi:hypothetical protein
MHVCVCVCMNININMYIYIYIYIYIDIHKCTYLCVCEAKISCTKPRHSKVRCPAVEDGIRVHV